MLLALLAAISLDSTACASGLAANCPKASGNNVNPAVTITTGAFSTSGSPRTLVAVVDAAANASLNPSTISWNGGTPACASAWTKQTEQYLTGSFPDEQVSSIWTATTSSTCTSVSVTLTDGGTVSAWGGLVTVYVLTGTSLTINTSNPTTTGTGNPTAQTGGDASHAMNVTLTSAHTGGWLFVGIIDGNSATLPAAQSGTTFDQNQVCDGVICASGSNTAGAGGSVVVGSSASDTFEGAAGLEVFESAGAAATPMRTLMGVGQ